MEPITAPTRSREEPCARRMLTGDRGPAGLTLFARLVDTEPAKAADELTVVSTALLGVGGVLCAFTGRGS